MYKFLHIILIIILVSSCEDKIDLNLPERDKRLVIEGLITNENTPYIVKLSNTTKYYFVYDSTGIDYETGATVIISDNLGNKDTLKEITTGTYQTNPLHIKGEIGRSYKINIKTLKGIHYESLPQDMLEVPKIDSIYYDVNYDDVQYYNNYTTYGFSVYINWHDPPNVTNYYQRITSFYWNNLWHAGGPSEYNDQTFNGQYVKKQMIVKTHGNGSFICKTSFYSLNQNNFDFWNLANQQLNPNGNGIVNSSVPLYGNVYNSANSNDIVLGYFQISAVASAQVLVTL